MSASAVAPDTHAGKRDHRQEVTDSIIAMLENGVAPWQKPWKGAAMPFNPTTERPYRGGNTLYLMATALSRGYEDPRWMTYKQAAEQGWQVKKGERGTHIEYWEVKDQSRRESTEPDQGDAAKDKSDRRLIHRVYTVFNAKQIDGVPAYSRPEKSDFEAVQSGERILVNSGARIAHDQGDRAFYSRASDSIHLPAKEAFKDAPGYYGTALHELAHWTGHPSRLNRPTLNDSYRFGDLNYAKEELRAELASHNKRLPLLGDDDVTADRNYIREFGLTHNRELGEQHGVEYAEAFHYIPAGSSGADRDPRIDEYIKLHAVPN